MGSAGKMALSFAIRETWRRRLLPFSAPSAAPVVPRQKTDALLTTTGHIEPSSISYGGASQSPRVGPWRPSRQHINSQLAAEAPLLRARIRSLISNTPYGANASETFVAYATGHGIKPSPQNLTLEQKRAVRKAWLKWTDEADADGLTDVYGLQSMAARAMFDAGECFLRRRDRRASDGLSVPIQIQLLEADQLDESYTLAAPGGNAIRMGIEFNHIGKRVAYHFWRTHPGDGTQSGVAVGERVRVPAEQVLHLFKPLRPGQIRGRPFMTPGMVKLYDLDQYDDAEIIRKKGAAMHMGVVTHAAGQDLTGSGFIQSDGAGGYAEPDSVGTTNVNMEPGTVPVLPEGYDIKFNQPADVGPNYEAFQYRALLALAASMGLPYFDLTGDTSKANYSSLRAAMVAVRRRIEQFQWETLIFQMCRPIYQWWLPVAVMSGALDLPGFLHDPDKFSEVKWMPPPWDWVDPLKDIKADIEAIKMNLKSRSSYIEERGEDPDDVDEEIIADEKRITTLRSEAGLTPILPEGAAQPGQDDELDDDERQQQRRDNGEAA